MALGEGCGGARALGTRDRQVEEVRGLQGEPKNCRQTLAQPHIEWMKGLLEVSGRPGGADFGEARAEHLVHSADGEAALVVVDSAMGGRRDRCAAEKKRSRHRGVVCACPTAKTNAHPPQQQLSNAAGLTTESLAPTSKATTRSIASPWAVTWITGIGRRAWLCLRRQRTSVPESSGGITSAKTRSGRGSLSASGRACSVLVAERVQPMALQVAPGDSGGTAGG